ncbi:MAG: NAD(P)H-dependent oxidoreductase subunit E [Firmicutes bacterium]|nr:NAD(P)H-dependent oxidoreductase subunit E [Bacillota bacterium]
MVKLKEIIERRGRASENLIHILLDYQKSKDTNYISEDEVKFVANELNIKESRVYSIITFYSLFSTKPRGKFIIQVCGDVPCYVNGSLNVVKELENILRIKMGETTPDGVFTLEHTSCLGCCDISPAIRIGEELYGNLTPGKIAGIISSYRRKYNENKE